MVAIMEYSADVSPSRSVEILILGAGWTSDFLIPLLQHDKVSYAATTTTGRDGTIPFRFDPESDKVDQFERLPGARTVLIVFPLVGHGQSKKLVDMYTASRKGPSQDRKVLFIQLGSTFVYTAPTWQDSKSPYVKDDARAQAEDELLGQTKLNNISATVLCLAGLYGGQRQPHTWIPRVIKKKSDIEGKKALHLVHGDDVALAVLGAHRRPDAVDGHRWPVTNLQVYDWWSLLWRWSGSKETRSLLVHAEDGVGTEEIDVRAEVAKLMDKHNIRGLPRSADPEILGRLIDSRAYWKAIGEVPRNEYEP